MLELFTIGHSIHPFEGFLDLLKANGISTLCDVRSNPYSRFAPQFNRESLQAALASHPMAYLYLGAELGPRSSDPDCYEDGKVQYGRLAKTAIFRQGLARLRKGMTAHRIALMCAEKDPLMCHRMILICRQLRTDQHIRIVHILGDGSLEDNLKTELRLLKWLKIAPEDLFFTPEEQIDRAYDLQGGKIAYALQAEG